MMGCEEKMTSGFGAILHRMNYINRWGIMRNARCESLSEHAMETACIAHLLAHMAKNRFGAAVDPQKVACCALYHDAAEIITGDLPTPVKYKNDAMRAQYKQVEQEAERRLCAMLPPDLAEPMASFLSGTILCEREKAIVKAADKLSALVKCMEEEAAGNSEFQSAKKSTLEYLSSDPLPETECFLKEFIPAYSMTLDELMALR